MSEISKTVEEILKVDEKLSQKVDQAKSEAKKLIEDAKLEIEQYRQLKIKELEDFKKDLEQKLKEELKNYENEINKKVETICSSILEISKSKKQQVIEEISSSVVKEIIGTLLSK